MSKLNLMIIFSLVLVGSISCGVKTDVKKSVLDSTPPQTSVEKNKFFLTTQENLLEKFDVIKQVNLYKYLPNLNELPIEYESFAKVYEVLKEDAMALDANRAVLKTDANCVAPIGYCEAYFIKVIKN